MIRLRQTFGAHTGRTVTFTQNVIRFGRSPQCEYVFDAHADLDASALHAEIRLENQSYTLTDTGSRNGTFVAGNRVTSQTIKVGDEIEFGEGGPRISVEALGETAPPTATPHASQPPASPVRAQSEAPVAVGKHTIAAMIQEAVGSSADATELGRQIGTLRKQAATLRVALSIAIVMAFINFLGCLLFAFLIDRRLHAFGTGLLRLFLGS